MSGDVLGDMGGDVRGNVSGNTSGDTSMGRAAPVPLGPGASAAVSIVRRIALRFVAGFVVAAFLFGVGAALVSATASAHAPEAHADGSRSSTLGWNAWSTDPGSWLALIVSAGLYTIGAMRLRRRMRAGAAAHRHRSLWFAAGWGVTAIALLSPIDTIGGRLFSVHMVQHELLMLLSAPAFVLSAPAASFLWALPSPGRAALAPMLRIARRAWRAVTRPLAAWSLHALALWGWHAPPLFRLALEHDAVHALQHATFLLAALVFWWSLWREPAGHGTAVLSLFTTGLHATLLGAFLTFSTTAWYTPELALPEHFGLTPLEDQRLGGIIMWMPGGIVYLVAALWLLYSWITRGARTAGTAARASLLAVLVVATCARSPNAGSQAAPGPLGRTGRKM